MAASSLGQTTEIKLGQISQKLMVQGYSGHEKYNGGLDVARKIIRTDGIRGFYRGFGLSVMTYSPSSAVWWASYGSSQRIIWRLIGQGTDREGAGPSESTIMLVMSLERRSSARQVVKSLIKDDGWTGFYRGLGPRFFSMSAWGTTMILAYEYLSTGSFSFTNIVFLDNEITNLRILTLLLSDFGVSKNNVVCKSLTAFHNLPLTFLLVPLAPFGTP
ncbi:hypothetical protein D5086_030758 [Populus alba]|uniref:Uncharacterized protein n=1 Tax=Populus alba TaxID=43335 RepID=A0ACC4APD3_POPAL